MNANQLSIFTDNNPPEISSAVNSSLQSLTSYMDVKNTIPVDLPNGAYISLDRLSPLKVYSLGFQPAKTIPEIPSWFLQKYTSKGEVILEPFAGSGTSIIEALKLGRNVVWSDNNPLSQLICRVKTTRLPLIDILEESYKIVADANLEKSVINSVDFSNKDFWFQKPVQEGLEIIKNRIFSSKPAYQPVLLLAFASTVRKCSDMNDGMILAARRSSVKETPTRTRADVFKYFKYYLDKIIEALADWHQLSWDNSCTREVSSQDARNLDGDWLCDAVVTSPPYINAIDYVWASKFELHWLDFVKSNQDRLDLYSKEIGTERISSSNYKQLGQTGYKYLDNLIAEIFTGEKYQASKGQNQLRARVVYKYFMDMKQHFYSCYHKLKAGGHYCFAVGDFSRICGVDIPVADSLTEFAATIGFQEVFRFHLLLKNRKLNIPRNVNWAGTIKHDTIVVIQKH
ncbi:DNA methylase [Cylindrospermum stagnale PCC 7417]|uniref:site-specific DNA-methyltransferase (cytosine-N(4)-specific) n=1 Tax=Cylindrospermum stagnale PCC 7417 TaxID=56107 RepID=K9WV70_9NOST|nr:DNA methylase [Cylindrospermum stagnale]AFZ24285.1 DNA methylase [Cylindrospermum stagnale PCC 7417]